MFEGIRLNGRTLEVLAEDYAYCPSSPRSHISLYSNALRAAAENGGNEHDAAAMFMASLCEMLCHSPNLDADTRQFIRRNVNMMLATLDRMNSDKIRRLVQDLDKVARGLGA